MKLIIFIVLIATPSCAFAQPLSERTVLKSNPKEQLARLGWELSKSNFFDYMRYPLFTRNIRYSLEQQRKIRLFRREFEKELNTKTAHLAKNGDETEVIKIQIKTKLLKEYYKKFQKEILEEDQVASFEKLRLQYRMSRMESEFPYEEFIESEIRQYLDLTEKQIDKIKEIAKRSRLEMEELKIKTARKWWKKSKSLISLEQRKKLKKILGEPPTNVLLFHR